MPHGTPWSVADMPGFAETDPQKKISIIILQKCFLTRNYHKPLLDLLGDKYDSAIDHICFVLTKNDGVDVTRARYDQQAVQLLFRILDRD